MNHVNGSFANECTTEALKQLLILERTPEPEPVSPAQELSFLGALEPEQRQELEAYVAKMQNISVKREREENGHDGTEAGKRARKQGEKIIIDLTLD